MAKTGVAGKDINLFKSAESREVESLAGVADARCFE